MKKRLKYIDIARGLAIVLVVMGHCNNFEIWSIEKFSALFFMQVFIFISGMFFKKEINSFKELIVFLKNKCLPIYKYYLKYEIIFYLLTNIFIKFGFYNTSILYGGKTINCITSIKEMLTEIIRIVFFMGREPFCGAFWFLIVLIFIIIVYAIINYISRKIFKEKYKTSINVMVLLCFFIGCIMRYTINIPRFSPTFTLILFYHLGKLYGNNINHIKFNNNILFAISIIGLNILYFFGSISINSNSFTDPIYLLICSILGIYMVMFISKKIEYKTKYISEIISYIGKNTLPILALHFISFKLIMIIQLVLGLITFEQLGILKGANNDNILYISYVFCGISIPLIINNIKRFIVKKVKG